MGQEEPRESKRGKRYRFELSRTSVFLWGTGLFVLLAWIFTLGVLAGRGLLPGGVQALTELKAQIAKLQQMISNKDRSELDRIRTLQKDPEFDFFQELSQGPGKRAATATAREKAPKTKSKGQRPRNVSETPDRYIVQVASLDAEAKAAKMVDRLTQLGYPAYFYRVYVRGRAYFRVRCGMFETEAEAVRIKKRLGEKEGLSGYVQKIEGNG